MTFQTMGGDTVTVPLRGKHYIQPRGYAAPPGTGPKDETCKSCKYLTYNHLAKSYPKCGMARGKWTGGRASDILVNAPACRLWEPQP